MAFIPMRLITLPISHYCDKARWALDRQGLSYIEEGHAPLLHILATLPVTGLRSRTVPILIDENPGQRHVVADSTEILRYLERRYAATWLFAPPSAAELEHEFDTQLGPHSRRLVYFHLLPQTQLISQRLALGVPKLEAAIAGAMFPAIRALMRRGMKINPDSAARSLAKVEAVFARVDERLRDGRRYLCGDTLSAADLTFACLSAPVVMPPNYGTAPLPALAELPRGLAALVERFRATAAGQLALRLYAEDRRR